MITETGNITDYNAYGAALDLWQSTAEEVLIEGPAGTGKTRAVLEKMHRTCQRYPGCRILFLRKTRESMTQSVLVTFETFVIPSTHPILAGGPTRRMRATYTYPNGSEIVLAGMDRPLKVMSTEYDIACFFEATEFTEDEFEMVMSRLRWNHIPYQAAIADCNPGHPGHWLNQRAKKNRSMVRLRSRHEDNPRYYDHELKQWRPEGTAYLAKLEKLTGPRYQRLRRGVWAAAEGQVYEAFDPAIHVIDKFEPNPSWRRIRVIDFGTVHPFVCQWWAIDNEGRMYLYRELHETGRLVAGLAREVLSLSGEEKIEMTICDHDAQEQMILDNEGLWNTQAYKDITTGVQAVQARLAVQDDGLPRLMLMRGSLVRADDKLAEAKAPLCTEDEFPDYMWPKTKEGRSVREVPIKVNDDSMDAMRYGVAYIDNIGAVPLETRVIGGSKYSDDDDDPWWSR